LAHQFRLSLLAAAAMSFGLVACTPENPASEATTTPVAAPDGTPAAVVEADGGTKNFVEKAAISDMYEVESSKLALERSKVQPVKDYAQMMIDTYTATSAELGPLASAAGVSPPTALDNDHMAKLDELKNASMADFDDKYIDQQTAAHSAALDLMKDYANNGKDAQIQAFAAKTAPVVDAHLVAIKALDKSPADDVTKAPNN